MRILLHVIGMATLGAAALLATGLLYEVRVAMPLPLRVIAAIPTAAVGTSGRPNPTYPAAVLAAGVRKDLEFFVSAASDGQRTDAVRALDAAYRLADVLDAAVREPDGPAADLFDLIRRIRRDVQNGAMRRAIEHAQDAAALAPEVGAEALRPPAPPAAYVGAIVLTPTGQIAGTVRSATADAVVIEGGGLRNLLGFVNLSAGSQRTVNSRWLVFGPARTFGKTMVVESQ
jgi:hypothetical protein